MKPEQQPKEVVYSESGPWRLVDTVVETAGILGLLYFNHQLLDGNGWLDAIFVIYMLIGIASMMFARSRTFRSRKDLDAYLDAKGFKS